MPDQLKIDMIYGNISSGRERGKNPCRISGDEIMQTLQAIPPNSVSYQFQIKACRKNITQSDSCGCNT
jgi:hypothetical protein